MAVFERWWLPLLAPLVLYGALTIGDRVWPLSGAREVLARERGFPVLVYFTAKLQEGGDQARAYAVLPRAFRTGTATVVTRKNGQIASHSSRGAVLQTAVIVALCVFAAARRRRRMRAVR